MPTFAAGRCYLFLQHTDTALRSQYQADLLHLFYKGFLFDIKSASILVAVLVLPALLSLWRLAWLAGYARIHRYAALAMLLLGMALTVGNVFYYSVYNHPFDVFVFGLIEEDTIAVLKTIWSDYPVLKGAVALLIAGCFLLKSIVWLERQSAKWWSRSSSLHQVGILVLLILLSLTAGIRTSFGKFPLRKSSAQVSPSDTLNQLVPNPITALGWAWAEYQDSDQYHEVNDADGSRLFGVMLGKPVAQPTWNAIQAITPENPAVEKHAPNVVLAVMESMSSHLALQFDQANTRDLLGALRPHWEQDWLYKRFVSEGNGTSDTMHRLLIRSPFNNVSQTRAKNTQFASNMFTPYLQAGYTVVYITAGNGGWRDLDQFTKHLGVHEFVDETALRHRYPEAKSGTWGVPDEYMFRYAAERLAQAEREHKPVFILMLSITNHPPYEVPSSVTRQPFALTESERQTLRGLGDDATMNEILNTYRYANNALGEFISQAKNTGNTIIAATGDHNMRAITYPNPSQLVLAHAVPFYLYVPDEFKMQAAYNPSRLGSHKDIMPTLYELSLSKQPYWRTGCNLTSNQIADNPWCGYGYNSEMAMFPSGAIDLRTHTFYAWQNPEQLMLHDAPSSPNQADTQQIERAEHFNAFLNWTLNRMVMQKNKQ